MKTIDISTTVFATIWSNRLEGEESENVILERILGIKPNNTKTAVPRLGKKMRWVDDVTDALRQLDGKATYADIYKQVRQIRISNGRSVPRSFNEVVRKEIETHSSDSEAFAGREDLFYAPDGIGSGIWALR